MAKIKTKDALGLRLEYYSSFGRIADPEKLDAQLHYLYEVVDVLAIPHFELNVGIGEGLTSASNAFVTKVIVGYSWESDAPHNRAPLGRNAPRPGALPAL